MRPPVESLNVAVAAAVDRVRGPGPAGTRSEHLAARRASVGRCPLAPLFPRRCRPEATPDAPAPLAERMRPRTLDEFVGQDDAARPRAAAARGHRARRAAVDHPLGPARHRQDDARAPDRVADAAHFIAFSAVLSGIKEIKAVMAEAEEARRRLGRRTILFVDEIHRFNKAQQDAFLPRVEAGDIVLVGRDHREPVVRGERGAALALEGVRAAAALGGGHRGHLPAGARRRPSAGSGGSASRPPTTASRPSRGSPTATRVALNLLELAAPLAPRPRPDRRAALVADALERDRCSTTRAARSTTT
jgi:putative ATPase